MGCGFFTSFKIVNYSASQLKVYIVINHFDQIQSNNLAFLVNDTLKECVRQVPGEPQECQLLFHFWVHSFIILDYW